MRRKKTMERHFVRKNATIRKPRSVLSDAQGASSNSKDSTQSDDSQPGQSLLGSTARRIGSVLGKIVARTENSFSRRKPIIELPKNTMGSSQKTSAKRKSPEVSEKYVSKAGSKTQVKRTLSVGHSRSKNLKRQSRVNRPASRKAPSTQE
jgi:hypothetical protein